MSSGSAAVSGARRAQARRAGGPAAWTGSYLRRTALADCLCAVAAGAVAYELRFDATSYRPATYLAFTALLPILWIGALALAGGYDPRFIGVGSDEFRRVINAAVTLTATIAILSYAVKFDTARGYVVIALPCVAGFDLVVRHRLRKRLHRRRSRGACMRRVVAVGHAPAVADLIGELRRGSYHGLSVVGACLAGGTMLSEIAGVPVVGGRANLKAAGG
jgi:FlaA1/EpsC-like NDP-sugar epimerase